MAGGRVGAGGSRRAAEALELFAQSLAPTTRW